MNYDIKPHPDPSPVERGDFDPKVCSPSLQEKGLGDEVLTTI